MPDIDPPSFFAEFWLKILFLTFSLLPMQRIAPPLVSAALLATSHNSMSIVAYSAYKQAPPEVTEFDALLCLQTLLSPAMVSAVPFNRKAPPPSFPFASLYLATRASARKLPNENRPAPPPPSKATLDSNVTRSILVEQLCIRIAPPPFEPSATLFRNTTS